MDEVIVVPAGGDGDQGDAVAVAAGQAIATAENAEETAEHAEVTAEIAETIAEEAAAVAADARTDAWDVRVAFEQFAEELRAELAELRASRTPAPVVEVEETVPAPGPKEKKSEEPAEESEPKEKKTERSGYGNSAWFGGR